MTDTADIRSRFWADLCASPFLMVASRAVMNIVNP